MMRRTPGRATQRGRRVGSGRLVACVAFLLALITLPVMPIICRAQESPGPQTESTTTKTTPTLGDSLPATRSHTPCLPDTGAAGDSSGVARASARVTVYYFHQTIRCPDCIVIETIAKDIIEEEYAGLIEDRRLRWQAVDFELEENVGIAQAYGIESPSLLLSRCFGNDETDWLILAEVWDMVEDTQSIADLLRTELDILISKK
ncbi:nitrophenyl compound nitroreductase subunit ArsF family protein [Candidatus Eisenbacteria bacterium]|uniref:Nitrophenyl compound nitroreductase subunit ArsF family protein n=1 Tax=Eiseniibacteriota bacterium TaxID=2212470 RepID=A0ABV6YJA8_UNCEI